MYKKFYKTLKQNQNSLEHKMNLFKNIDSSNAIKNRQPHFIFSAENPLYDSKLKMSHEEVLDFLKNKGYSAESARGKWGKEENSIIVHNPPTHAVKHLMNLSKDLGQESSVYSDGHNHELHYHNGPNAGMHHKGQGTNIFKKPPEDFYTSMSDGTHFSHSFNFDDKHERSSSILPKFNENGKINKSENLDKTNYNLYKNSEIPHPLESADENTKLIHYSPNQGLTHIDPNMQGKRMGAKEAFRQAPQNKLAFFYLSGSKPEPLITQNAKSKYIAPLGDKRLYDIGKDPENIYKELKIKSQKNQINPGIVDKDEYHDEIRQRGYHGFYNSKLDDTMRNVVGMFGKIPVESEHPIHKKDYERASHINHHELDEVHKQASKMAEEEGHHNPDMIGKIARKIHKENMS